MRSNDSGSERPRRGATPRAFTLAVFALALAAPVGAAFGGELRVASSILSPLRASEAPAAEAGVLLAMGVDEGDLVEAGQTLGRVDARSERLRAATAAQDLAYARREAESDIRVRLAEKVNKVSRAELRRAVGVNEEFPNTVSETEVERLRLSVEQSALEIEHARFERSMLALKIGRIEADLRLAEHLVERMRVVAPISGVVAEVHKRAGEWVDRGEPVLRIVRVDRLKLEGYVPVADAAGLVGRPVRVEAPLGAGRTVRAAGRVVFVSPEAEPVNAQVLFRAEIDNTAGLLRPGLKASLVVIGERPAGSPAGDDGIAQTTLNE